MGGSVDFAITRVDGSDPDWQARKAAYSGEGAARDFGARRHEDLMPAELVDAASVVRDVLRRHHPAPSLFERSL